MALTRVTLVCILVTIVRCRVNAATQQEMKITVDCNNQQPHVDITLPTCRPVQECPKCALPLPPTRLATPTGSGYELFPGLGHYKLHAYGATWLQGQQRCAEEGAHLVIVNSRREAEVVKTLFTRYPTMPGAEQTGWAWTAVHEHDGNGNYVTIFGESLASTGFATWSETEPNDSGPNDCVLTNRITAYLADAGCYRLFAFICELELQATRN